MKLELQSLIVAAQMVYVLFIIPSRYLKMNNTTLSNNFAFMSISERGEPSATIKDKSS